LGRIVVKWRSSSVASFCSFSRSTIATTAASYLDGFYKHNQVMLEGATTKPAHRVSSNQSTVRIESGYMEPTEVNANHFAQLAGGWMSL
jgi:alanine racemase